MKFDWKRALSEAIRGAWYRLFNISIVLSPYMQWVYNVVQSVGYAEGALLK